MAHTTNPMLLEFAHYLASIPGTPPAFRPHLRGAIGLWARGRRQSAAWAPHVQTTRRLIAATIPALPSHRTVVVLGSGPLFDVPLETLAGAFQSVILVDQAHPASARWRAHSRPNVHFLWRDLSVASPLAFLKAIPDLDWVISVNLVSQLALGAPAGGERAVIDAHLDALAALPCQATLATDLDYQCITHTGEVTEDVDLLHGRAMPSGTAQWHWDVAPFGEEDLETRRTHRVTFYPDWTAAGRSKTDINRVKSCSIFAGHRCIKAVPPKFSWPSCNRD